MKATELKEDKAVKDWLAGRTASEETRNSYVQSMQWYNDFAGKSPEELLLEAEKEIKDAF